MVSVFDVVRYILERMKRTTAMKLQKLVYYCQAWSLVWDEQQLFKEKIEAWANGPVVRELYDYQRGMFEITDSDFGLGDSGKLNDTQKETIDAVLDYYGGKSPQWLSDLTHKEDPWRQARQGLKSCERGDNEITLASMQEYCCSLQEEE